MLMEKSFDTGEVTLIYDEGPDNGPPMVLLHGLTDRRQKWRGNFVPAFGEHWHQYLIDQRGHGQSGRAADPSRYRLVDYAGDVVAFLRDQLDAPAVVVGHSLGAINSIGAGATAGDRVRARVLTDPPLLNPRPPSASMPLWFTWVYETVSKTPSHEALVAACRAFDPEADETQIQDMAAQISGVAPETVRAALDGRVMDGIDMAGALRKITCPTLLVYGDQNQGSAVSDAGVAFVRENLAHVQTVRIENGSHMFAWELWDETRPHVEAFLAGV